LNKFHVADSKLDLSCVGNPAAQVFGEVSAATDSFPLLSYFAKFHPQNLCLLELCTIVIIFEIGYAELGRHIRFFKAQK